MTEASTREAPGEFDALPKLRPGEPYFALIGRDRTAPPLVEEWADLNRKRALADFDAGSITREKRDAELVQSTQAEMVASEMRAWKAGYQADSPNDEPVAETKGYTGHVLPAETAERDREARTRIRATSAIQNAIAELTDTAEALDTINSSVAFGLRHVVKLLRDESEEVAPRRPALEGLA